MSLPSRKIGSVPVLPIGFGTGVFMKSQTDEERFAILNAALARGCTHWDCADIYGDAEKILGRWFKHTGKRNEIYLTTKFGYFGKGDPDYVRECFNRSLENLGVDYVDLYYQHRPDENVPIEITVGAMAELVNEGKVGALGLSECCESDLRRAHIVHPIAAYQVEYHPFFLDIEDEQVGLLRATKELGIAVVAYSPLGKGLAAGRFKSPDELDENDYRRTIPKFSKENFPKILSISDKLKEVGKGYNGATAGQVTLAWLLAQSDNIHVIPGTTKVKSLEENIDAAKIQLKKEDIDAVRAVAEEANKLPGDRYSESMLALVQKKTPQLTTKEA